MARMIPPQLSHDCRSPGEKLLFERFRDDPGTEKWVVLHSLGIAKHPARTEGEIDFVILVPGEGILCLEVKAGNVTRENGLWKYGTRPEYQVSSVGPFRQASEGMHAIRTYVSRTNPDLARILFFSGVLFTYISFNETSPEWHQWQHADRNRLCRSPISEICLGMLRNAHKHIRGTPSAKWYHSEKSRPTSDQVERVVSMLRGDFEFFISPRTIVEESEAALIRFTEEQFSALDVLLENDRIIYKGPAGTGKTFLAVEACRRSILAGKRTLLTCYNSILGNWLTRTASSLPISHRNHLTVGTFHAVLLQLSGLHPPRDAEPSFWSKRLPDAVTDRILRGIVTAPLWDTMVVDEAQDLISDDYLDVMDLLLSGGLSGGRWAMFGDFERQAIYSSRGRGDDSRKILKSRAPVHFTFPLRTNCRNTVEIASGVELACKLEPGYSRVLHHGISEDLEVAFFATPEEQCSLLKSHLGKILERFTPSEVVILSTREDASSCAAKVTGKDGPVDVMPYRDSHGDKSCVSYTSIHAFKGMESPAVILTDLERISGEKAEALLYVGMSRARLKLVMLLHENCRDDYLQILQQSIMARGKKGAA